MIPLLNIQDFVNIVFFFTLRFSDMGILVIVPVCVCAFCSYMDIEQHEDAVRDYEKVYQTEKTKGICLHQWLTLSCLEHDALFSQQSPFIIHCYFTKLNSHAFESRLHCREGDGSVTIQRHLLSPCWECTSENWYLEFTSTSPFYLMVYYVGLTHCLRAQAPSEECTAGVEEKQAERLLQGAGRGQESYRGRNQEGLS